MSAPVFRKRKWNPPAKDGLATHASGPSILKSKLEEAPLFTMVVACRITFTFGELTADPDTASIIGGENDKPMS